MQDSIICIVCTSDACIQATCSCGIGLQHCLYSGVRCCRRSSPLYSPVQSCLCHYTAEMKVLLRSCLAGPGFDPKSVSILSFRQRNPTLFLSHTTSACRHHGSHCYGSVDVIAASDSQLCTSSLKSSLAQKTVQIAKTPTQTLLATIRKLENAKPTNPIYVGDSELRQQVKGLYQCTRWSSTVDGMSHVCHDLCTVSDCERSHQLSPPISLQRDYSQVALLYPMYNYRLQSECNTSTCHSNQVLLQHSVCQE